MPLTKAKCPNCGELIEVETNEFNVICKYCGVPFMPKEGVDLYNEYIHNTINKLNIDTINISEDNINNYCELGLTALRDKNPEKCGFYADDILKRVPTSPEGLLLKGYFVSDNYSKEEGLRYYFNAYENSRNDDIKKLIIDTLKEGLNDYSVDNFQNLFIELLKRENNEYNELLIYALTFVSSELEESPFIDELNLSKKDILKRLNINFEEKFINLINERFIVAGDNDKLELFVDLNLIDKTIDKYQNKTGEHKISYCFYFGQRTITLKSLLADEDIENLLKSKQFNINDIKAGCYVATCVYGSYNSPEVWVLRRFRDYSLKQSYFGKLFIKLYYAISPFFVRLFGKTKWFNRINKCVLDKFVGTLKNKGYSDKPYRD